MTTLTQMIDRCKQASDSVNSSFISDPEWTTMIAQSYAELYGLIVQAFSGDYFVKDPPYTFTTDGINDHFALPSDVFKLLGVDVLYGSANQWVTLKPFTLADRNRFSGSNQSIPAAGQTVRLLYVPSPPVFDSGNPLSAVLVNNGWDQYIVADACIKALAKEESDVSVFAGQKSALLARLDAEAENRDAGNPQRMVDSRGRGSPMMAYRLDGAKLWLIGQRVIGQPYYEWANPADGWW
jgi:hypothetical protein